MIKARKPFLSRSVILCLLLALTASGCAGGPDQGRPAPTLTVTPYPTATAEPTAVPAATMPTMAAGAVMCGDYDLQPVVAETLALLDDPRAVEAAALCVAQVERAKQEGIGSVEGEHPFWAGARYRIVVSDEPLIEGSSRLMAVSDVSGLSSQTPVFQGGAVQTIAVFTNREAEMVASEARLERAVLHECAHVGQHWLRFAYLGTAGVPEDCLDDANQFAQTFARLSGHRAEPLAYAAEMLAWRQDGDGKGPMYEYFESLFGEAESAEEIVGSEGYGRWQYAIAGYVESGSAYLRPPYLLLTVGVVLDSPDVMGFLDGCAEQLSDGYADIVGAEVNPFEAYGTPAWKEWETHIERHCFGGE